ncbi:MAG: hypothetical protein KC561_12130, partial [Myxococcales bacterium]|nr:hypothetical protein [Myxococcales bacterium]
MADPSEESSEIGSNPAAVNVAEIVEILRLEPSARVGGVLYGLGQEDAARSVFTRAWKAGDQFAAEPALLLQPDAHLASSHRNFAAQLADIPNISDHDIGATAGLLIASSAYRLRDVALSCEIGWQLLGKYPWPPLFTGFPPQGIASLEELLTQARNATSTATRTELLLGGLALAAEGELWGVSWLEEMVAVAEMGTDGLLLPLVLSILDVALLSQKSSPEVLNFLAFLATRIEDPQERLLFKLWQAELLSKSGRAEELAPLLREISDTPPVSSEASVFRGCQVAAERVGAGDMATHFLLKRAERTPDKNLRRSLLLQAEFLARRLCGTAIDVQQSAEALGNMLRRSGDSSSPVYTHNWRTREAMLLQLGSEEQLKQHWSTHPLSLTEGVRLRQVLYRPAGADWTPSPGDLSGLANCAVAEPEMSSGKSALALLMLADGWEALLRALRNASESVAARFVPLEIAVYCRRLDRITEAAELISRSISADQWEPTTYLLVYALAEAQGEWEPWVDVVQAAANRTQ